MASVVSVKVPAAGSRTYAVVYTVCTPEMIFSSSMAAPPPADSSLNPPPRTTLLPVHDAGTSILSPALDAIGEVSSSRPLTLPAGAQTAYTVADHAVLTACASTP